jgi:hypothetical protein
MNSRYQGRKLIGRDLVPPNICGDDVGRVFSVERWRRLFVWHLVLPVEIDKIPCRANIEMGNEGISIAIAPLRLPPFGSSGPMLPRLSSVVRTWEVESEIYGGGFLVY